MTSSQLSLVRQRPASLARSLRLALLGGAAVLAAPLAAQDITTVAGNGVAGYSGDGGLAIDASLLGPYASAVDGDGNLYLSDTSNYRIRRVTPEGVITTVAGTGVIGMSGDGGPAVEAKLRSPVGLIFDAEGNLLFTDATNGRIRRIDRDGIIDTLAGRGENGEGCNRSDIGDGGPATEAYMCNVGGMDFDADGNLYVAEFSGHRIRKITPDGVISTVAGTGVAGFSGDGGPATAAQLAAPHGLVFDRLGNMYIPDYSNNRIRKISPDGIISTYAGTGTRATTGDGGPALAADLNAPWEVAINYDGELFVSERMGHRVRKIALDGSIDSVVGTGVAGFAGDGGPAVEAQLRFPHGISLDAAGTLYITENGNHRVRAVLGMVEVDRSAPSILPLLDGPLGDNDWYRGPVSVAWQVSDAESAIEQQQGCEPQLLSADDPGTTLTCSASSQGGQSSVSVTIKIDASAPTLTAELQPNPLPLGADGQIEVSASDALSGLASTYCDALRSDQVGAHSTTCVASDRAGNQRSIEVHYSVYQPDTSAPLIELAVAGTLGDNGWYRSAVAVDWSVSDAESAIEATTGCDDQVIDHEGAAIRLNCSARSAGGTASRELLLQIDRTAPTLAPQVSPSAIPRNGSASVDAGAADALSGLADASCESPRTDQVGTFELSCSARDNAGNRSSARVSYSVYDVSETLQFIGFAAPVANLPALNRIKAGQAVPLKWQLLNAAGQPYDALAAVDLELIPVHCRSGEVLGAATSALDLGGLQPLGDGHYQINWKSAKADRGSCLRLQLDYGAEQPAQALFELR